MKDVFDALMGGLGEVEAFLAGQRKGFTLHVPEEVDVKTIRKSLKMTQSCFSDTFGFALDSIKNWEMGRRKPEAAARILLTVIEKNPCAVLYALRGGSSDHEMRVVKARMGSVTGKEDRFGLSKSGKSEKATHRSARVRA